MATAASPADGDRYLAVYDSVQFKALRRRSNSLIAWTSGIFYGWWLLVISLAAFVPSFFRQRIGGPINVGLLFVAVSLFVVIVVSAVYLRLTRTRLDPISEQIRTDLEGDPR